MKLRTIAPVWIMIGITTFLMLIAVGIWYIPRYVPEVQEKDWDGATGRYLQMVLLIGGALLSVVLAVELASILRRQQRNASERAFLYRVLGMFGGPSQELRNLLERDDLDQTADYVLKALKAHSPFAIFDKEQFRKAFTGIYPELKAKVLRQRLDCPP
jgi:hypothetical protein